MRPTLEPAKHLPPARAPEAKRAKRLRLKLMPILRAYRTLYETEAGLPLDLAGASLDVSLVRRP